MIMTTNSLDESTSRCSHLLTRVRSCMRACVCVCVNPHPHILYAERQTHYLHYKILGTGYRIYLTAIRGNIFVFSYFFNQYILLFSVGKRTLVCGNAQLTAFCSGGGREKWGRGEGVGGKGRKGREEDIWREEMGTHLKDDRECIFGDGNGTNLSGNKMGHRVSERVVGVFLELAVGSNFKRSHPTKLS